MVSPPPSEPSAPSRPPEPHSPSDAAGPPTKLLSISWNQDHKCFAVGAADGFRLYNCDPFGEALRRDSRGAGFGIVEMLYRCNCFALVGNGADPQMPPNKVKIWDDLHDRFTGELAFRSSVCGVKLRDDRIVVVLERMIYVYRFPDVKLLGKIVTSANPNGVCALSHDPKNAVLACPGVHTGQVRIENFGLKTMTFISAHDSQIACLALSSDGCCCATASTKGTLVRLFNTKDGTCLQEVRRGTDKADIYSINFSPNLQWLAVTSGRGTVHVFSLRNQSVGEDACQKKFPDEGPGAIHQNSSTSHAAITSPKMGVNPSSKLSFFKGMLPKYFSSQWSFAQFHLSEATRYVAAFGAENTVAIVGMNGSFYRCSFDPVTGGQMLQMEHVRFLEGLHSLT